jgi:hypothetical protein
MVSSLTIAATPFSFVIASRREAMLTVSPMTVNSRRSAAAEAAGDDAAGMNADADADARLRDAGDHRLRGGDEERP